MNGRTAQLQSAEPAGQSQPESLTRTDLSTAAQMLEDTRETAAAKLWSFGLADPELDADQAFEAEIENETLDSCGEIAQAFASSSDPNLKAASEYLMDEVESLRTFNDSLSHPFDLYPSRIIAQARFLGFAADAYLKGDEQRIESVTTLEAAAERLPDHMGLWFSMTSSGGAVSVTVKADGYTSSWERGGGGWMYAQIEDAEMRRDWYAGGEPLVAAGMHVFHTGGSASNVSWSDPLAVDSAGFQNADGVGSYDMEPFDEELFVQSIALVPGE